MTGCIHAGSATNYLSFIQVYSSYCRYLLAFYLLISVQPWQEMHIIDVRKSQRVENPQNEYEMLYIYISDWIRKKVPAEFDLSLIDLDTILS